MLQDDLRNDFNQYDWMILKEQINLRQRSEREDDRYVMILEMISISTIEW